MDLDAEIAPVVVEAGQQTDFVVSLQTHMRVWRTDGSLLPNADTGFQSLRIQTTARIDAIDRVLVDDREVEFTATYDPIEGDWNSSAANDSSGRDVYTDFFARGGFSRRYALRRAG